MLKNHIKSTETIFEGFFTPFNCQGPNEQLLFDVFFSNRVEMKKLYAGEVEKVEKIKMARNSQAH